MQASRWLVVTAALIVLAPAPAAHAQPGKPDPEALVALLRAGDYAALEARMAGYQSAYEASTDGEWDLLRAFAAFERVEPNLAGRFDAWVALRPQSYSARVARGAYYLAHGWASRGAAYAADTAEERFSAMRAYFQRAQPDFEASLALTARPTASYRYLISVAMAKGDQLRLQRLYLAALRADPENYGARRYYFNSLLDQWGGRSSAARAFIGETYSGAQSAKMRTIAARLEAALIAEDATAAERAGDRDGALQAYAEALSVSEDPFVLSYRAALLVKLNRDADALRDVERALALNPSLAFALEVRGIVHEREKRMREALEDYVLAANYGSTYAMQRLGILHISGGQVRRDYAVAAKWLQLGAAFGEPRAQTYLGWMYSDGYGVPRDRWQAITLWRSAAAQGNADARKYLDDVPWWWNAMYQMRDVRLEKLIARPEAPPRKEASRSAE